MKLIKLWEADLKKAYQLQTSFGPNENGFINNAYGYTFAEFLDYVKKSHFFCFIVALTPYIKYYFHHQLRSYRIFFFSVYFYSETLQTTNLFL